MNEDETAEDEHSIQVIFDSDIQIGVGELCGPHPLDGSAFCALRDCRGEQVVIISLDLCPGLIHGLAGRVRAVCGDMGNPDLSAAIDALCDASENLLQVMEEAAERASEITDSDET